MRFLNVLLLLGCLTFLPQVLQAITFVGGFEGNIWSDYRNWSPQQVPGAGDDAVIPENKQVVINGAITVGSLILAGGVISDGNPDSKLTITTGFSWTGGSVGAPIYVGIGASGLWQGSLGLNANLFNFGEITVSADVFINYATLRNEAEGVLNLTDGHKLQIINNPAVLDNYGVIRRTGLGGLFQILLGGHTNRPGAETIVEAGELYASSLDNYAPIHVAEGAMFHSYDFRVFNGSTFTGDGTLKSSGNGMYMNNTNLVTIDIAETILNSQGIKQDGSILFLRHLNWQSGTFFSPTTFAPGCIVDVNGAGAKGITGIVTNNGIINVNASFGFDYGLLNNYSTINLNGAFTNGIYHATDGIYNYGLIKKTTGAIGVYNMGVPLHNEAGAQLLVQTDELYINAPLYNAGYIVVEAGATLRANFTEARSGCTFTGTGSFIIQNNGLNAANTSPVSLDFSEIVVNASISGAGAITLGGHVDWMQGDFAAPITILAGITVDMNPGGNHGVTNTTTNNGTFNINTSFTLSAGQIINNGTLSLNGPYLIGIYYGTPGIFNHGTVIKPANSAGIYNAGVPLTNYSDGMVVVENGELYVNSIFTNAGSLSVANGAICRANNTIVQNGAVFSGQGTYIVGANGLTAENSMPVTFNTAETTLTGPLNGTGSLVCTQHVSWQNANLGCTVTIAAGATLDLSTNGSHGIGGTLNNNGTINAEVNFGGGTVNNYGALYLAPDLTIGGGTLNNAGTITNSAGGNETIAYQVSNTGSVIATAGLFIFSTGLSNAGLLSISTGAAIQLEGYSDNSIDAGSSITGQGTFVLAAPLSANADASIAVENFVLNTFYGITGTGTLTFEHAFEWQNGSISNNVTLSATATMNINSNGFKNLSGVLTNGGIVNCQSDLDLSAGAAIYNNGAFYLAGGMILGPAYYVAGDFYNAGVLSKTGADHLLFNTYLHNQSSGVLNIDLATLEVGKLDNAGAVSIAPGAVLIVKDGSNMPGGTVSGNGTLRLQANGWFLSGTLVVNGFLLEVDANLGGNPGATLEVQGNAIWYSGEIAIPVNIAASGTFNTEGYGSRSTSAPLANNGTFNDNGYWYAGASVVNNNQLLVNGSGGFSNYSGETFTNNPNAVVSVINNPYGLYINILTINHGVINISEGSLYMNSGFTNNGSVNVANGTLLSLGGQDLFNAGSSFVGNGSLTITNSLALEEPLNFAGETFTLVGDLLGPDEVTVQTLMSWQGGAIHTNLTIAPGATLNISASGGGGGGSFAARMFSYGQSLAAVITNNGTTNQSGSYDMDGGTFINNGLFAVSYAGINNGGNGGTLTNNGMWEINGGFDCYVNASNNGELKGNGYLTFDPEMDNYGTVSPGFSPGQFTFTNNYQSGATLNIEMESSTGPGIGYDYIEAGGDLQIGGVLNVVETGNILDGAYTILRCTNGPGCRTSVFASANLPAGYALSYTDQAVVVTKGQPISVSPADTTICYGNTVTLTAPEASAYLWSTGETSQSITVFPYEENTYFVTIAYSEGGGAQGSATVHVAQPPYVYIYPYYSTVCQGESLVISAEGDPGTYLWSNGQTTQSIVITPEESTYYEVTVTNAAGCTASSNTYVEVGGPSVTPVIEGLPSAMCQSEGIIELPVYQSGYYGEWSGEGVVGGSYFDPASLAAGNYALTYTPYPGQCATPATWVIALLPANVWYADADGDGYGTDASTLTACSQPEGYTNAGGDCNDANASVNPGATEICNNIDDDCDGQTDELGLELSLSAGSISCNGGATTLSAAASGGQAPYLYSFNGGPFGSASTVSIGAGMHTVTARDANNCQYTADYVVSEPAAILINPVTVTHVVCEGGNTGAIDIAVTGGTGAYTYHWSNNRTTQDITGLAPNTYHVTVTDANGCTATVSATVNPKLALTLNKTNTTCNGGSDGTISSNVSGGTPPYTYAWSTGATTPAIENLPPGSYTLTVTDALGCVRTKTISVGQPAAITISGSVQQVSCNGGANGSINITHNNGVAPFMYEWSDGATTMSRTDLAPGVYTLTVTDANGCNRSKSFTITQPTALSLSFTGTMVTCNGSANGSITATTSGGVKYPATNLCHGERYCYQWNTGDTTRTINNLMPGLYSLTVTDANGCSINGTYAITEPEILEITGIQTEALSNGKYRLTVSATGGTTPYKYKRIAGSANYQTSNIFTNVPAGAYLIVVQDKKLCTDTVAIDVPGTGLQTPSSGLAEAFEIQEETTLDEVTAVLFPNPASNEVHIAIKQGFAEAQLQVYDVQGKMIYTRRHTNETALSIDVSDWRAGLYLVSIQIDGQRITRRLSVVR